MSLVISTGSNLGDREINLEQAKQCLTEHFNLMAESALYISPAVDYTDQPDFYNQVLEFKIPPLSTGDVMETLLKIEDGMGRIRRILKGPRLIDLDLLFWGDEKIKTRNLTIPHPRLFERSFVILPLRELPCFSRLEKSFFFPDTFDNQAFVLNKRSDIHPSFHS